MLCFRYKEEASQSWWKARRSKSHLMWMAAGKESLCRIKGLWVLNSWLSRNGCCLHSFPQFLWRFQQDMVSIAHCSGPQPSPSAAVMPYDKSAPGLNSALFALNSLSFYSKFSHWF
ncbi:uncharacterized protein LOC130541769 isoform X3 [Pan paniscus]|uniref:uncharacterized protein LOC130541769 isoform X3 n=1 Tax=Pan paniscus TaxID=9597 RepID=UPI0025465550|nr:uncharacterized protein LOC130541769 isoform X6 [Pan paniscus]